MGKKGDRFLVLKWLGKKRKEKWLRFDFTLKEGIPNSSGEGDAAQPALPGKGLFKRACRRDVEKEEGVWLFRKSASERRNVGKLLQVRRNSRGEIFLEGGKEIKV